MSQVYEGLSQINEDDEVTCQNCGETQFNCRQLIVPMSAAVLQCCSASSSQLSRSCCSHHFLVSCCSTPPAAATAVLSPPVSLQLLQLSNDCSGSSGPSHLPSPLGWWSELGSGQAATTHHSSQLLCGPRSCQQKKTKSILKCKLML